MARIGMLGVLLWTVSSIALAQGGERRAPEPPPPPGEAGPGDANFDTFVAWNAGLDAVREDRQRQLRLTAARRVAPFDLNFGLEE